ncbi:MAG: ISAs1 family transposase [Methylobacteriaceae bacterium]|nr:ISAs1 family transposase [Methylobacteriaceae bacterium]
MDLGDRPRLRVLLDHFASLEDDRESWRVAHPLPEVLLLAVCGTIGACDDFDEIVEWGEDNLPFLRRFLPYHHGVPGSRWLRALLNRIDPGLFGEMFQSWAAAIRPEAPALVAIDGKSSRGSCDRGNGRAALHLVSAFATREKLVLAQEAVAEGASEQTTIPLLLEKLAAKGQLQGALVSIDAVACNAGTAQAILDAGADYLLAVKANQPSLMGEIARFFDDPAAQGAIAGDGAADKGHGRVEERAVAVSTRVDWLDGGRRFPGEHRFPGLALIARVSTQTWQKDRKTGAVRYYVCSRAMSAQALAEAVRSHWAIENSLHWVLDVTFGEDKARSRTGHGPANMAVVRHFAFNILRAVDDKRSLKLRRNKAARNPDYMAKTVGSIR